MSLFGLHRPCSQNLTVECPTPILAATSFWVTLSVTRAFRNCSPKLEGDSWMGFQTGDFCFFRVFRGLRDFIVRWQIPNSATTLGTCSRIFSSTLSEFRQFRGVVFPRHGKGDERAKPILRSRRGHENPILIILCGWVQFRSSRGNIWSLLTSAATRFMGRCIRPRTLNFHRCVLPS
jgi:hypothetical protein